MRASVVIVVMASLALAGCELPQEQLICTRQGVEVYRSPVVDLVTDPGAGAGWHIDGAIYTPEPGTVCRRHLVR